MSKTSKTKSKIKSVGRLKPVNPARGTTSVVNRVMRTPLGSSQATLNTPGASSPMGFAKGGLAAKKARKGKSTGVSR